MSARDRLRAPETKRRGRRVTAGDRLRARIEAHPRHAALVGLAAGLAAAPARPTTVLLLAGAVMVGILAACAPRVAVAVGVALLVGHAVGHARVAAIDRPGAALARGDEVRGLAHLLEAPRSGRFGAAAQVRMSTGPAAGVKLLARLPPRSRLPPTPGAEIALAGSIRPPPKAVAGGFDLGGFMRRRGIAAELAVSEARSTGRRRGGVAGAFDRARVRAERAVGRGLSEPEGALVRGMVLGQDEAIGQAVREDFRDSGLAHLLAVSGQNVMLLAALALPLLAMAGLPPGGRVAGTVVCIAAYVPLAGAGPSLQRAGVMGAASLVALAAARPASRAYALLLAAAVTLAANPHAVSDPGWQLSFAAVAGILALAPGIRRALAPMPRVLAEGVAVTVAATLATAPLLGHHFGSVPVAGLLANLVALPLVAPIMWLGMLRAGFGQLGAASDGSAPLTVLARSANVALGPPLRPLTDALGAVAAGFSTLPGGRLDLPLGSRAGLAGAYVVLGLAAIAVRTLAGRVDPEPLVARWRRLKRSRRMALACATGGVIALVFARMSAPGSPPDVLTVSFLDVGQGDATLVQHPDGTAVLFDGGPPEGRVAQLLRRAGVRRLSVLVMTHASRDHHGGLAEVVDRVPVDLVLDGGDHTRDPSFRETVVQAERRGARRIGAVAPASVRAGRVTITVLGPGPRPPGAPPEDSNPRAVVALVSSGGFRLLLSADAESPSLLPLDLPDVDAMKVPHHGSADPGLADALARLRPEVAAIEVGENSYGHPAPSTLAALRAAGAATLRTDRNGTIRLRVTGGRIEVAPDRGGPVAGAP